VVAIGQPSLSDLLVDGETAFLVDGPGPRPIAQRVLDLRADAEQSRRVTENAKQLAATLFAPDDFVRAYRKVYEMMTAPSRVITCTSP
jgi:glycosyltransferase involved in cell wall biosynthesis